jgi:threonine synthase
MEYISTRNSKKIFSFKDVFLNGLAPDGGLFIPKDIPVYNSQQLKKLKKLSYNDLATRIISQFCYDEFSDLEIKKIVNNSYKNFRVKDVVKIKKIDGLSLLELFHGPTLAFKDIAMQIIGNMYEKILKKYNSKINIIVATSGDTGAAAISAIKDRVNMKIFVIHPENKISQVQRKFMTTVASKNVFNIAVDSNFDECQRFIKLMFADTAFRNLINMSGVNSINWVRIVVQTIYYFYAYFKVAKTGEKINFAIPTGNFGNVYAGYVAKKMGLPINKLIISTNSNDILKRVVRTGIYKPTKVEHTISPSMDIQVASNFERLLFDLYEGNSSQTLKLMNDLKNNGEFKLRKKYLKKIQENFISESLSEKETKSEISRIYKKERIMLDPHTAVAVGTIGKLSIKGNTIVLATAHPAKFSDMVVKELNIRPELPEKLKNILNKKESYKRLSSDLKEIKKYIIEKV